MTTTDVNVQFVVPWTARTGRSVCEQILRDPLTVNTGTSDKFVGEASWFISHAWKYPFLSVVEAINLFFSERKRINLMHADEDPIVWFDLFSNSQHNTGERPFEWWETTFIAAIKKMRNVVMVCIPWDDSVTLKRAWCVFEVYAAKRTNSQFHIAMTRAERDRFAQDMVDTKNTKPAQMMVKISIDKCESFKPTDRENIFQVIQSQLNINGHGGISRADSIIKDAMRTWMIETLGLLDQTTNNPHHRLVYVYRMGHFYAIA
ncbi:Kinesin light chain 3, partial [Physocladia obscura]